MSVSNNATITVNTNNASFNGLYEVLLWSHQLDITGTLVYRSNYTALSIVIGGDTAECNRNDWTGGYTGDYTTMSSYYAASYRAASYH